MSAIRVLAGLGSRLRACWGKIRFRLTWVVGRISSLVVGRPRSLASRWLLAVVWELPSAPRGHLFVVPGHVGVPAWLLASPSHPGEAPE